MQPRRKQPTISFRSAKAAERLRILTRDGRSQAQVIEEALERMPDPAPDASRRADALARLRAITARTSKLGIPSMAEFDAREYDENGNLR